MARKKMSAAPTPVDINPEGSKLSFAEQAKLAELRTDAAQAMKAAGIDSEYTWEGTLQVGDVGVMQVQRGGLILGSALLAIRANEGNERFRHAQERWGLGDANATLLMSLARHVAKSGAHRKLHDAMGQSKAMVIFRQFDDADIAELVNDEGQLEEYAGKSVRQLVAEINRIKQEAAETASVKDSAIAEKNSKIDALKETLAKRKRSPARNQVDDLLKDAADAQLSANGEIQRLIERIREIRATYEGAREDMDEVVSEAIDTFAESVQGWAQQLAAELAEG